MRQHRDLQYLYNVARDFTGKCEVCALVAQGIPLEGDAFCRVFRADVESLLQRWSYERLGVLAAYGRGAGFVRVDWHGEATAEDEETRRRFNIPSRTTLQEVGFDLTISNQLSGYDLLLKTASLTVVAAMLDLARLRHRRVLEGIPERDRSGPIEATLDREYREMYRD